MSKLPAFLSRLLNPRVRVSAVTHEMDFDYQLAAEDTARRRRHLINRSLHNPSLVIGALITLGLILIVFFGPFWASQNPHLNPLPIPFSDYDPETNTTIRPPLAPSAEYPLGTDTRGIDNLSNLLHGARITLVTALFITLSRIILGLIFGSIAGWSHGKVPDKVVMRLITIITAIPMLISGMILIYAIGIEAGMVTFIIALSIIGWTETAQIIRSEVLVMRRQLFVEAARSIGLKETEIVVRHLLPNIVPKLFIISFLEMGAVLILMAELGFLGVFMGGNNRIIVDAFSGTGPILFPDTPEWGAMLSEGVRYLRSKPFVIIAPATAFFISIIGFNSLGEGLRSLFERTSINTAFLLKKRFVLIVVGVSLATFLIIQNTGPSYWYERTAASFDPVAAQGWLDELEVVAASDQGGATVEGHELTATANFLYESFKELDIKPGWKEGINSRYIYAPDEETAHVIGFWPGYDLDLAGELIILFTTYDVPGENDNQYPLGVEGHDLTDLAVMLETIEHLKNNDINPRRSLLFVAWQATGSEQNDLEEYAQNRDNFRKLSTGSGGVRIAPTMVLQIDSSENPSGVWIHPDSPARLARLISDNASFAGADELAGNGEVIDPLVTSLPWTYMIWRGDEGVEVDKDENSLALYGETLSLTLITLLREEQSWVAEAEARPEPVFIPPTATPGGAVVDESDQDGARAIGVVSIIEGFEDRPYKPGEDVIVSFDVIGEAGSYLEGQFYDNLRMRVSLRSTVDESMLTFNDPGSNFRGNNYSTWIRIPEDADPGDYVLRVTSISTSLHGNELELVGDLEFPVTIEEERG